MSNSESGFYAQHVFCCTNERPPGKRRSCGAHHADRMRDHLKDRVKKAGIEGVRVNAAGCLNRCEYGPVMVIYPSGTWYHYSDLADVEEIFQSHIVGGKPVERLLLRDDQR